MPETMPQNRIVAQSSRVAYVLKKAVIALVLFRVTVLAVAAFLPLSVPGVWRQTDTMGVALRYWLRWTVESGAKMPLLPAVLNSGNTSGIMPMEFPILNLVAAPAFAFGPYGGRVILMLALLFVVHGLIYLNYRVWKDQSVSPTLVKSEDSIGVASFGFFLMAVATFSSGWTGKFIPDFISVLLILLGVGLSWSKSESVKSGLLCTIGILMKPTSVVVLALYLCHPRIFQRIKSKFGADFLWAFVSVVIGVLYYKLGMKWIAQYQDGRGLFAVGFRPFFTSLVEFFSDVKNWTNMWMYRPFFSVGLPPVLLLSVIAVYQKRPGYQRFLILWLVLLLQYVLIAGLDGTHGFAHDYYFLGLAPTSALILWWLFTQPWPKWVIAGLFIGVLSPTVELSLMDLRPLYKPELHDYPVLPSTCDAIKRHHPEAPWGQGAVFRASNEEYPALGLCFGEREGSPTAAYGFFWKWEPIPSACQVRETTGLISFVHCS